MSTVEKNYALGLEDFKNYQNSGFLVIDTRSPQEFAEGFIPGAINIPYEYDISDLVTEIVQQDRGVIFLAHNGNEEINAFKELGFSNIGGYLEGGFQTWLDAGEQLDMVISIGPNEFSLDFKHDQGLTLYDIRPEVGFQQEHLKDSYNRSVEEILKELEHIQDNKTYYVMCWDGYRSMGVVSLLKARDYHNFYHVAGGFKAVRDEEKVELIKPKKQQSNAPANGSPKDN